MYSAVPTKLPLATWAQIMQINPLHFGQVQVTPNPDAAMPETCGQPWIQYGWQKNDAASRDEVARAIQQAESDLERELGYRLLPSWEVAEWHATVRPFQREYVNFTNRDIRGFAQASKLRWGWLVGGGVRAATLLEADAAIVYTDPLTLGYPALATVTAAVPEGTDPCEVHVYYPGKAGDPSYEIRPITVTVAGAVATITFRRENAVLELYIEDLEAQAVPAEDNDFFLETVDVYRVYNDRSTHATLLWESAPGRCNCGSDTCVICQYTAQTGCIGVRGDPLEGWAHYWPATWNEVTEVFDRAEPAIRRQPEGVKFYYYAGFQDLGAACPTRDMNRELQRVITYYACSMLDRPPCGCVAEAWTRWAQDLAFTGGAEELSIYQTNASDLASPFGTRRGAIEAWRFVKRLDQSGGPAPRARVAFPA